jgi:hypothetical protein
MPKIGANMSIHRGVNYHRQWQDNRLEFILSLYNKDWWKDKRVLELGSYNGKMGEAFRQLGAEVTVVDGRHENIVAIRNTYPDLYTIQMDLDTDKWLYLYGKADVILNQGLIYHLTTYHRQHLLNCITNCKVMFLDSVVYDSTDPVIYYRKEEGDDQSLSGIGGTPSARWVEDILNETKCKWRRVDSPQLGDGNMVYDWLSTGDKPQFNQFLRRFWIIETTGAK